MTPKQIEAELGIQKQDTSGAVERVNDANLVLYDEARLL